ncbi:MAG: hypothetical protein A3B25_02540 [Candidatus Ryanbacteria bacterium RIFCSPLOWO2_01_FULL_48_26]|uniref:Uncharacterized protein n=1 Tax=Candidatus Ryanbacteria bacterium RIFCSPLOWO2_01_FULL_48_26 TaxID=1802126 RepID=A0A1G2GWU5_9BACT|nr:MAG: hypothetical protein A3B25_02540 [Candidatus Ryanbacteria bacterium RIFCSPLOWO2_01_FULL_48_26]
MLRKLIIPSVIVVILFVTTAWYWYFRIYVPQNRAFCNQEAKQCPDGSYVGRIGPNCEFTECPNAPEPTWDQKAEQTRAESKNWPMYKNTNLGFTLKYPPVVYNGNTVFIPAGNVVFVTTDTSNLYKKRSQLPSSDEQSIINKAEKLEDKRVLAWVIKVRKIITDEELDRFIKDHFGDGCKLGKRYPTDNADTFSIGVEQIVQGDMDTGSCFINWIALVKYSPKFQRAAIWDMGQDSVFDLASGYPADRLMEQSFQFIESESTD